MKHKRDMTLEYLDGKINRLKQEFRDWERARIHWERERDERLEKLEEKFKHDDLDICESCHEGAIE